MTVSTSLSRWFAEFKEDVLAGRVSLEELIAIADADMQSEAVELCPECVKYPVRTGRGRGASYEGLCAVCWLHRLRDAHIEQIAILEARTELDWARQVKHRARRCSSCGTIWTPRTTTASTLCPDCARKRDTDERIEP